MGKLVKLICMVASLLTAVVAMSCAPTQPAAPSSPTPVPATQPTPTAAPAATPTPAAHAVWAKEFEEWESKTYDAAKREGRVVWYVSLERETVKALDEAFGKRYPGLKLELQSGRGDQIAARIIAEQNSRQQIGDLIQTGLSTLRPMAMDGRFEEFTPPVTKEPGVEWLVDVLKDQEYLPGKGAPFMSHIRRYGMLINTTLVPPNREPKSWLDLVDPWWKGKIIAQDPRTAGGGQKLWYLLKKLYGEEVWQKLVVQALHFDSSLPALARAVATGEYHVALQGSAGELPTLKGAPVKLLAAKEGTMISETSTSLVKGAPHLNATKLFLNFQLMKEAQDIYGQAGRTPVRADAKVAFPELSLVGLKLLNTNWDEDVRLLPQVSQDAKKYIGGR